MYAGVAREISEKIGIFFDKKQEKIGNFHAIKQEFFYEKQEKIRYFQMKKEKNSIFSSNEMRGQSKTKNKI